MTAALDLIHASPEEPASVNAPATINSAATTDLALAVSNDPGIVLLDSGKFDAWYDKLKAQAPTDVDVATSKGRDTIRSYAAKVRSEKAAIDKARLSLTKQWRDMTSQANAAGKVIEQRLESLAAEVRAPLTEWEEAEKARVQVLRDVIDWFRAQKIIAEDDTASSVRDRGNAVYERDVTADEFRDLFDEASAVRDDAIATLKRAMDRLAKEEADRAELERLRAEAAEREERERREREERELAEREAEEARLAEEHRVAAEKAEADRIERERAEAAENARAEAEAKARAEQEERERAAQAEIDAANERARKAEQDAQAERERIAAEQAAREAEGRRIADEKAKRAADETHRTKVKTAAKQAIMTCGADEDTARKIVLAIIAGEVPNVALSF